MRRLILSVRYAYCHWRAKRCERRFNEWYRAARVIKRKLDMEG